MEGNLRRVKIGKCEGGKETKGRVRFLGLCTLLRGT